jgi:anti-sigma regulatory factor (Ser/Thr protein kinase)
METDTTNAAEEPPMDVLSLSILSDPKLLRVARCVMAEVAELTGFSLKDRDKICLAVGEACSNIIRHSYKGRTDGQIIIRCKLESDKITISIRDFGEKFDLARVRPPDIEEVKPGGLGVHLIRSIMDKVEYDMSHEVGTEINMTKYVHPQEAPNDGS